MSEILLICWKSHTQSICIYTGSVRWLEIKKNCISDPWRIVWLKKQACFDLTQLQTATRHWMLEHIGVEGLDILALQEARDQVLKFLIYLYNQAYTYMTGTHTSQINTKHIFVADSAARLPYSLSLCFRHARWRKSFKNSHHANQTFKKTKGYQIIKNKGAAM